MTTLSEPQNDDGISKDPYYYGLVGVTWLAGLLLLLSLLAMSPWSPWP